jgi:hypothetical protein
MTTPVLTSTDSKAAATTAAAPASSFARAAQALTPPPGLPSPIAALPAAAPAADHKLVRVHHVAANVVAAMPASSLEDLRLGYLAAINDYNALVAGHNRLVAANHRPLFQYLIPNPALDKQAYVNEMFRIDQMSDSLKQTYDQLRAAQRSPQLAGQPFAPVAFMPISSPTLLAAPQTHSLGDANGIAREAGAAAAAGVTVSMAVPRP